MTRAPLNATKCCHTTAKCSGTAILGTRYRTVKIGKARNGTTKIGTADGNMKCIPALAE